MGEPHPMVSLGNICDLVAAHREIALLALAVGLALILIFHKWIWRRLCALSTAQILMILISLFLFAAFFLPQNSRYDKLSEIVACPCVGATAKRLGLLNVFASPWLWALLALLVLNLVVCCLHQIRTLFGRRTAPPTRNEILALPAAVTLTIRRPFTPETQEAIRHAMKTQGLRAPQGKIPSPLAAAVYEKGSGTLWPAALFHVGLLILVAGCLVTWLFGAKGYVTVYKGSPVTVPLMPQETRWANLSGMAGWVIGTAAEREAQKAPAAPASTAAEGLWVGLTRVRVVYRQSPVLNYPTVALGAPIPRLELIEKRLRSAWAWGMEGLKGTLLSRPERPAKYSAFIQTYLVQEKSQEHELKPAHPIEAEGLRISLAGLLFKVDIEVEKGAPLTGLTLGTSFKVPGAATEYYVQDVTAGVWVSFDGKEIVLTPTVWVAPVSAKQPGADAASMTVALPLGESRQVGAGRAKVTAVVEGASLNYRRDPGLPISRLAVLILLFALVVRLYWPYYRVRTFAEDSGDGGTSVHLVVEAHGLFSDSTRIQASLTRALHALGQQTVR